MIYIYKIKNRRFKMDSFLNNRKDEISLIFTYKFNEIKL